MTLARVVDGNSPAGRAHRLASELIKQGRMSSTEADVIYELVWHPQFPDVLREDDGKSWWNPAGTTEYLRE